MRAENVRPKIAIPEPCASDKAYSQRALPPYIYAVESCGGEAVTIPLGLPAEIVARTITGCNAVLLPGSPADVDPQKYSAARDPRTAIADPLRDSVDELLLQDAWNLRKPVFGICYGLQSLNVWRSGSLVQHLETGVDHSSKRETAMAHQIRVKTGSLLAQTLHCAAEACDLPVNSSHHQAAGVIGDGLAIAAQCLEDGTVEAVEGTAASHFVLAVQWHPERTFEGDAPSRLLFETFIRAAREWRIPA